MFAYYTSIIFLNVFATAVLQTCVSQSNTLTTEKKRLFHWLFGIIALASICEWFGVLLDGAAPATRLLHIAVKATELSVAPSVAFIFAWIIEKKWMKAVSVYLLINAVLECLSGGLGFIYYVDGENYYHHGPFYWIYVAGYMLSILFSICIVARNIQKYQYNGLRFFFMIVAMMLSGIIIQLCNSALKVDYVTLAITSTMLYVFTLEMIQQTDELTGLLNRRGYENYLLHIDRKCIVAFFDVDSFKQVNDTYGHAFGDHALRSIGAEIKKHYAKYGKCFRYGGDEFCVILTSGLEEIENIDCGFYEAIMDHCSRDSKMPGVSIGYAYYDPENQNIQDAIEEADRMMYEFKAANKAFPR